MVSFPVGPDRSEASGEVDVDADVSVGSGSRRPRRSSWSCSGGEEGGLLDLEDVDMVGVGWPVGGVLSVGLFWV